MLVWNYKPTCAYSIAVMLAFRQQRPQRRTLRYRPHSALSMASFLIATWTIAHPRPKCHAFSVVTLICDQALFLGTA